MASNRLRAVSQEQGEDAEMDMSPMIDMVFLLLLFFLVVSNPKTIKIDLALEPPVAVNAQAADSVNGKIVMNIHEDGSYWAEDLETKLEDELGLVQHLQAEVEKVRANGYIPVLHIRADKGTEFANTRRLIRAGAEAGIELLAYGAFNKAPPGSR